MVGEGLGARNRCSTATEDHWKRQAPERLWAVPAKIRDAAVMDVQKACAALEAKEMTFKRQLKFRTSKDKSQSISIESIMLNCKTANSVFAPIFGTVEDRTVMRTEDGKMLPNVFESDVRVQRERLSGRFFICIPVEISTTPNREASESGPETQGPALALSLLEKDRAGMIAAIDPGIRTFATVYDAGRERIVKWASGNRLLKWLARKIDRLERAAASAPRRKTRLAIHRLANRVRRRATNLTRELHHKLARWLCQTFEVVLLPKFSVRDISRRERKNKKRRVIGKKDVRMLYAMAPYTFRMFLQHKAREFGTSVIFCDEYYTSKTCTSCGMLDHSLGGKPVYRCPCCRVEYDRDAGAARNILLRYIATRLCPNETRE